MDYEEIIEKIKIYTERVVDDFHPKKVILYGSYVNNTAREDSDIDVAVILDSIGDDFLEKAQQLYKLRRGIDSRIEPLLLEEGNDKSGFYEEILETGTIIYSV